MGVMADQGHRIAGLAVSMTNPVFLTVLAVHVAAALVAVVAGAVVLARRDKGSVQHRRLGWVYAWALAVTAVTAVVLAGFDPGRDWPLALLAAVAAGVAALGIAHRRRRRPGHAGHIQGMAGSYVVMLTAFYVDNGRSLPLWRLLPTVAYWLLPAVVAAPLTVRTLRRWRADS
jgi:uncharacterized membrane protein